MWQILLYQKYKFKTFKMSDYRPPTYEEMTEMLMNPIEDVESSFKPEPIRDWTDEEKNPPSRKTDHENSTTNYVEKYRKNNEAMIKQVTSQINEFINLKVNL